MNIYLAMIGMGLVCWSLGYLTCHYMVVRYQRRLLDRTLTAVEEMVKALHQMADKLEPVGWMEDR